MLEDAAEPLAAEDTTGLAERVVQPQRRAGGGGGGVEGQGGVGAESVVVVGELAHQMVQVPPPKQDDPVEALDLEGLDEWLYVSVEAGRLEG